MTTERVLSKNEIWQVGLEAMNAFVPFYQQEIGAVLREGNLLNGFFNVLIARDTDELTITRYHDMVAPYGNINQQAAVLDNLVERGHLAAIGERRYKVTEKGAKTVDRAFAKVEEQLARVTTLPEADLERLTDLLKRILEATYAADIPSSKYIIQNTKWTLQPENASYNAQIEQILTILGYFRDDSHIASWQPQGVSGEAWEAFTFIWRGELSTPEAAAERLSQRGHDLDTYRAALNDLVHRGWLTKADGGYQLTDEGRHIREEAETNTDLYFFAGWESLDPDEINDLHTLLGCLRDSLKRQSAQQIWNVAVQTSGWFFQFYRHQRGKVIENLKLNNWFTLYLAAGEGGTLSVEKRQKLNPYNAPSTYTANLAEGVEQAGLQDIGNGQYRITDTGKDALKQILTAVYDALGQVESLPDDQLDQVLNQFNRLVDYIFANASHVANIQNARNISSGTSVNRLSQIDQFIDELLAFRDDAHFAAWQHYGVSGHAWDILTSIWRDQFSTLDGAVQELEFRGFTSEETKVAFQELKQRGWLTQKGDEYTLTDKGRQIREEAEAATDENFYQSWSIFTAVELNQLFNLFNNLRDRLKFLRETEVTGMCKALYPALGNMLGKLFPIYGSKLQPVIADTGFNTIPGGLFAMHLAQYAEPAPYTTEFQKQRFPYANPNNFQRAVDQLVEKGFLKAVDGGYQRTEVGKTAHDQVNSAFYESVAEIGTKVTVDLNRLQTLVKRVLDACANAPEPPSYPSMKLALNLDVSQFQSPLLHIDHYYDCLNARRDDAHIAAWRPQNTTGVEWETFTYVWQGNASTAAELQEKLVFRGHSEEAYAYALQSLATRGWVVEQEGQYGLTEAGKKLREEVEDLTNRDFYGPWGVLSASDVEEMGNLLTQLTAELEALAPPPQPAS